MSVMKNGNPGSLAVVSQWSEESCGQEQGGLEKRKRWARQPCLCFQLLAPTDDDDRRTRRVDVRVVSWRNSNSRTQSHKS